MRDKEYGLLRIGSKQPGEQFSLGCFVKATADFVEQEDVATMEQATGDGDALGLTFAESAASFTKFGVEAIG